MIPTIKTIMSRDYTEKVAFWSAQLDEAVRTNDNARYSLARCKKSYLYFVERQMEVTS